MKCPLCECPDIQQGNTDTLVATFRCRRCGTYRIEQKALQQLHYLKAGSERERALLSGVARQEAESGRSFLVRTAVVGDDKAFHEEVEYLVPSGIQGKVDAILGHIGRKSACPSTEVPLDVVLDYPLGFCQGEKEFGYYLHHLKEADLATVEVRGGNEVAAMVTVLGWEYLAALKQKTSESPQAFVAMSFDLSRRPIFDNGISPVEATTGFKMVRLDNVEHIERIDDRLLVEIRRSRFLVAEMTGHNRGVYFEAGYAMGLGLPVIWVCKDGEEKGLHFDTRQYNFILWKDEDDLKERLANRILAVIGKYDGRR